MYHTQLHKFATTPTIHVFGEDDRVVAWKELDDSTLKSLIGIQPSAFSWLSHVAKYLGTEIEQVVLVPLLYSENFDNMEFFFKDSFPITDVLLENYVTN